MERYHNEPQGFKVEILYALFLMIGIMLVVAYVFYLIPFDLLLIFSLIKIGVFYFVFSYILRRFNIFDRKYVVVIGLLSGLILFLLPHFLTYLIIINNGYKINDIFEYVNLVGQGFEGTSFPIVITTEGVGGFVFFEGLKLFFLVGIIALLSNDIGQLPFSKKHNIFYHELFNKTYNIYKKEHGYLKDMNDEKKQFQLILNFLNDSQRFVNLAAQKGLFKLLGLPQEDKNIVFIKGKYFLLNPDESKKSERQYLIILTFFLQDKNLSLSEITVCK
jgi:hypothetical protein